MRISAHKKKMIEKLLDESKLSADMIAQAAGVKVYTVYKIRNGREDKTTKQARNKIPDEKRKEVEELLQNGDKTINQIAMAAGVSRSAVYNIRNDMEYRIRQESTIKREPKKNFRTNNMQDRYYISRY